MSDDHLDDGQDDHLDDGQDDLVDAAFGRRHAPLSEPARKKFEPWHLPRKHYCRIQQWCTHVAKLIDDLDLAAPTRNRPLRYLCLPGDEFLDVRTLSGTLKRRNVTLQFLGFLPSNSPESSISYSEVRALETINEERTELIAARIEEIASADTLARRSVSSHVPFDVVNLDLCQSVLVGKPRSPGSLLEALRWLLEQQLERRGEPWLLFLTTRLDRSSAHADAVRGVLKAVEENMPNSAFAGVLEQIGIDAASFASELAGTTPCKDETLPSLLSVALGKWLLLLADQKGWTIECADCACYTVNAVPDMFSLVYRFRQRAVPLRDNTGLTQDSNTLEGGEVQAGVVVAESVRERTNVDNLLRDDEGLRSKTFRQFREILALARHDTAAWEAWAHDEMVRRGLTNATTNCGRGVDHSVGHDLGSTRQGE